MTECTPLDLWKSCFRSDFLGVAFLEEVSEGVVEGVAPVDGRVSAWSLRKRSSCPMGGTPFSFLVCWAQEVCNLEGRIEKTMDDKKLSMSYCLVALILLMVLLTRSTSFLRSVLVCLGLGRSASVLLRSL